MNTTEVESKIRAREVEYDRAFEKSQKLKQEHLRLFRPNLENPANKEATAKLNSEESDRSDLLKDVSFGLQANFALVD